MSRCTAENTFTPANYALGGVVITDDFLILHDLVGPSKTSMLSTVTAIYDVGCFVGAVIAFTTGERLGRKRSVLLGTTIMAIGAALQTSSFSVAQMFAGRIVLGYAETLNAVSLSTNIETKCNTASVTASTRPQRPYGRRRDV